MLSGDQHACWWALISAWALLPLPESCHCPAGHLTAGKGQVTLRSACWSIRARGGSLSGVMATC